MKIIKSNLKFTKTLNPRATTTAIVLHHTASKTATAQSIHQTHLNNGWAGAGYHYLVRKNGKVYALRNANMIGAHCLNHNANTLGVVFEGNFETEKSMPKAQVKAGHELLVYLKKMYPKVEKIYYHKELMATACPGKNFDSSIRKGVLK